MVREIEIVFKQINKRKKDFKIGKMDIIQIIKSLKIYINNVYLLSLVFNL